MSELLHERIDLLWPFDVGPRWCQGEVIKVYENRSNNKVRVLWDPMPDVEGCEDYTESDQKLLQTKWNKDVAYAWRMGVDIEVQDEMDDEIEVESNENESESEESECEVDSDSSDDNNADDNASDSVKD